MDKKIKALLAIGLLTISSLASAGEDLAIAAMGAGVAGLTSGYRENSAALRRLADINEFVRSIEHLDEYTNDSRTRMLANWHTVSRRFDLTQPRDLARFRAQSLTSWKKLELEALEVHRLNASPTRARTLMAASAVAIAAGAIEGVSELINSEPSTIEIENVADTQN